MLSRGGHKLGRLVEGYRSRSSRNSTDRRERSRGNRLSFGVLFSDLSGNGREGVNGGDAGRDGEESRLHREGVEREEGERVG